MREIKFRAEYEGVIREVKTVVPKRKDHKGYYKMHGYIMRRVKNHPYANKRGYVPEHRLVMEQHLGRFLDPRKELVHHIDGNRSNNDIQNLKLTTPSEHFYKEHFKARNQNGKFAANEPIFGEIKFRLYDRDKNITQIYTLRELISKTYRRAKFEFRGRFTGLKDKNGKEIYEGDILLLHQFLFDGHEFENELIGEVVYDHETCSFALRNIRNADVKKYMGYEEHEDCGNIPIFSFYGLHEESFEKLGNVYENPELLEGEKHD